MCRIFILYLFGCIVLFSMCKKDKKIQNTNEITANNSFQGTFYGDLFSMYNMQNKYSDTIEFIMAENDAYLTVSYFYEYTTEINHTELIARKFVKADLTGHLSHLKDTLFINYCYSCFVGHAIVPSQSFFTFKNNKLFGKLVLGGLYGSGGSQQLIFNQY